MAGTEASDVDGSALTTSELGPQRPDHSGVGVHAGPDEIIEIRRRRPGPGGEVYQETTIAAFC